MISRNHYLFCFFVLILILIACQKTGGDRFPAASPISSPKADTSDPDLSQAQITFKVTFDENHQCIIDGPDQLPEGKYSFRLDDRSGLNVDLNVVHLIDGHDFQDLLDLQDKPGEPFIKVYWMSLPFYFTTDHVVWTYTLDEPGEHAILILQHVFEGS